MDQTYDLYQPSTASYYKIPPCTVTPVNNIVSYTDLTANKPPGLTFDAATQTYDWFALPHDKALVNTYTITVSCSSGTSSDPATFTFTLTLTYTEPAQ